MIRAEMKKYLYFPYLLLAVIGCVVLAFSANADYDPSGSAVSVFWLAITGIAHKSEQPIEYSALFMWIKGMNGWLPLILPLLMSFGYIAVLSAERHNGMTGFLLIRSQNAKYCATKVAAGVLTGGTLFMTANIVFGLMMLIVFPAYISFSADEQMMYADWYGTGTYTHILSAAFIFSAHIICAAFFGCQQSQICGDTRKWLWNHTRSSHL